MSKTHGNGSSVTVVKLCKIFPKYYHYCVSIIPNEDPTFCVQYCVYAQDEDHAIQKTLDHLFLQCINVVGKAHIEVEQI